VSSAALSSATAPSRTRLTPGLTYCGFNYAGHCGDFSGTGEPHACAGDPNGAYTDCRQGTKAKGGSKKYREVVTTFVSD